MALKIVPSYVFKSFQIYTIFPIRNNDKVINPQDLVEAQTFIPNKGYILSKIFHVQTGCIPSRTYFKVDVPLY